jgi:hypothetical protein
MSRKYYTKAEIDDLTDKVPMIDAGFVYIGLICLPKEVIDRLVKEIAIFVVKNARHGPVTGGYHECGKVGKRGVILLVNYGPPFERVQRSLLHEVAHWWLDHLGEGGSKEGDNQDEKAADTQIVKWIDDYMNFYNELPEDIAEHDYSSMYRLQKLAETHFLLRWDESPPSAD